MATKIYWLRNDKLFPSLQPELDALFTDGYEVKIATSTMIVLFKSDYADYNEALPEIEVDGVEYVLAPGGYYPKETPNRESYEAAKKAAESKKKS